jgi:predicted enzyme related to lactoylglutathione lyase
MAIPASAKAMAFIVTRDRGKAKSFYGDTLGFALMQEDDYAAVFDLNGTKLRISEVADHAPQSHTVLGWEVADISETAKALQGKGIALNRYDGLAQDELGIWTAPGGAAKVAWFSDPDGNVLSLTQCT